MAGSLDCFFSFGSAYTYLTAMRAGSGVFHDIARQCRRAVVCVPASGGWVRSLLA